MKLFKIEVKDTIPDGYKGFIVVADTIPDALEYIYKYYCLDADGSVQRDIPYYLRSSNMTITCVGTIEMEKYPYRVADHILMMDYWEP